MGLNPAIKKVGIYVRLKLPKQFQGDARFLFDPDKEFKEVASEKDIEWNGEWGWVFFPKEVLFQEKTFFMRKAESEGWNKFRIAQLVEKNASLIVEQFELVE